VTISHNRQNQTPEEIALEVEIFDANGRVSQTETDAANAEIFHPANVVRVVGAPLSTAIDKVATLAKQVAAKAKVLARKK
jgi:hypothetical protein